ncbi:hypothetical protein P8C59_007098 [Phyllachora maydis]|uniref:Uncharacterized protein n=1 Tax=Phyllachora maydis TaxID=1825666 RepID=A0AAD9I858_9PEZI|nr:hypothetical protein P8C59_007098 [Phyllachora maydis]
MASLASLAGLRFSRARANNEALYPGNPAPATENNNNSPPLKMNDCQITVATTAIETAIKAATGAIAIAPIAPSSSALPAVNAPASSAPPSANIFAPFLRGLNNSQYAPLSQKNTKNVEKKSEKNTGGKGNVNNTPKTSQAALATEKTAKTAKTASSPLKLALTLSSLLD